MTAPASVPELRLAPGTVPRQAHQEIQDALNRVIVAYRALVKDVAEKADAGSVGTGTVSVDLSEYVKQAALDGYLPIGALSGYATTAVLTAAIADFVTAAGLTAALSSYATTASVTAALTSYVTTAALTATLVNFEPRDSQKRIQVGNGALPAYGAAIFPDIEVFHTDTNTTQTRSYGFALNHTIKPSTGSAPTNLLGAALVGNISTDATMVSNATALYALSFGVTHRGSGVISNIFGIDLTSAALGPATSVYGINALAQSGPGNNVGLYGGVFAITIANGAGNTITDPRVLSLRATINSGIVPFLRTLNVRSPALNGGTLTDIHGVYIEDHSVITASGVKNNITSKGVNSKNVFEGDIATKSLTVNGVAITTNGGAAAEPWPYTAEPAYVAKTENDEFSGNTLAAKWGTPYAPGWPAAHSLIGMTIDYNTTVPGAARFRLGSYNSSTFNQGYEIYQPFSPAVTGHVSITACVSVQGSENNPNGLTIKMSSADLYEQVLFRVENDNTNKVLKLKCHLRTGSSFILDQITAVTLPIDVNRIFLHIEKTSTNNHYLFWSTDGVGWNYFGKVFKSWTPTGIVFSVDSGGYNNTKLVENALHFIRRDWRTLVDDV